MTTPDAVLRLLADLAPAGGRGASRVWDVRSLGPVVPSVLVPGPATMSPLREVRAHDVVPADRLPAGTLVEGQAEAGAWRKAVVLHGEEEVGRRGRLVLAGRGVVDGERRTVLAPLLGRVVGAGLPGVLGAPSTTPLQGAGDVGEPTSLAVALGLDEDALVAAAGTMPGPGRVTEGLLAAMPRLSAVRAALVRAGVPVTGVLVGGVANAAADAGLWLCVGDLRWVEPPTPAAPRAAGLLAWAGLGTTALRGTALDAVYGGGDDDVPPEVPRWAPDLPRSPLPLTAAQRDALLAARTAPLTVVSGAPGTGKSHTAVAVALDEVARGGSVLLATRSGHAAEVLAGLLGAQPGPTPVRFGGGRSRRELADELARGLPAPPRRDELARVGAVEETAAAAVRAHAEAVAALLAVAGGGPDAATEALLRTDVPGAFGGGTDPAVLEELLVRADADGGWWVRWRAGRAARRLRAAVGAGPSVPLERVAAALSLARVRRLAAALEAAGSADLAPVRARFRRAAGELRAAVGVRLEHATRGAPDRAARRAVAGLAAALRAGPSRRAALLARLDADAVTAAMPLWVGTVADAERLLPRRPGMFDLVVLDEASQLDQLVAAPVLARAARALVVGDPRQLRHVSFVADLDVDAALAAHPVGALAGVLDVRRVSSFDAAAAAAPVRWLDEHLRSTPHIIGFSARRFYDEHLRLATSHPSRGHDVIDTLHVEGSLVDGVVAEEVAAVVAEVRRIAGGDTPPSVGVVTPFRDQADALEQALATALDVATVAALQLRVGTVHAFQGSERDVVLVSLGLTEDGPPQRRTFASDPHLVNVLVTRARRRVVVVTALRPGTHGLLGDYLAHAERPAPPPEPVPPADPWTADLLAELRRNGLPVVPGHVVGRAVVDLVVDHGDGDAVALLTRTHPDGLAADLERWATLRRAGWRVAEAYATPVDADAAARALRLRHALAARG